MSTITDSSKTLIPDFAAIQADMYRALKLSYADVYTRKLEACSGACDWCGADGPLVRGSAVQPYVCQNCHEALIEQSPFDPMAVDAAQKRIDAFRSRRYDLPTAAMDTSRGHWSA